MKKVLSFWNNVGTRPPTSQHGLCPWTLLGTSPPYPVISHRQLLDPPLLFIDMHQCWGSYPFFVPPSSSSHLSSSVAVTGNHHRSVPVSSDAVGPTVCWPPSARPVISADCWRFCETESKLRLWSSYGLPPTLTSGQRHARPSPAEINTTAVHCHTVCRATKSNTSFY